MPRTLCLFVLFATLLLTGCDRSGTGSADEAEGTSAPETQATETGRETPPAGQAAAVEVDTGNFDDHVETLAADDFGGRAPGTQGERKTLEYLTGEFRELGLEPGYGESFLQPVPMVEISNNSRSDLEIDFGDDTTTLTYPEDMILGSRRQESPQSISDSEMVFVGYGIVAPEYDWNDYEGLDVAGKTVVMLVNDPGFATGDEALFNGRAMTYYGRWTYKYEEAARQGAAAAIVVHETEPASYGWDVVINSWSQPEFVLGGDDSPRLPLEGWITADAAHSLFATAGLDFNELKAAAREPGFEWQPLDATASAEVSHRVREGTSYNVIARLPGAERPDEAVVYMAHWDHLGRNLALPGTSGVYNGAVDNASGTAALLELARLYKQAPAPERSVIFLAVTLEEYGLLGSAHYAANPVVPMAKTAAVVNMDAMSLLGPTRDITVIGHGSSELEDILAEVAATQDREIVPEPTPEAGYYYRSDHFNFAKAGVPALYAKGGVDHVDEGREYGLAWQRQYRDERYHKPTDVYNPDWDLRGIGQDIELLYRVGRRVADGDAWPNWYEGNEFRALRDRQRRQVTESD